MLTLYARFEDPMLRHEVEGVRAVHAQAVIGAYPQRGRQAFVRALEVRLELEEQTFAFGPLTLASVLSVFFARHVGANSFAQTVLHTVERREVHRFAALPGVRHSL